MKVFKLSLLFLTGALFVTSCNQIPQDGATYTNPEAYAPQWGGADLYGDDFRARDNLDLRAVAALLERSRNAEELEYLLNAENGVNNLDLNDDGYVDYIGVSEFEDRDDNERGLSLFSRFGPDLIQEIATIFFDRDGFNDPGARILLRGDEDLYGDNYYYETNWRDRALPLIGWLFNDRDDYYQSPYYYENYPEYYEPYEVVEVPVYRTRIEQYYPAPTFVYTAQPTITDIRIQSPYHDYSIDRAKVKLPKYEKEKNPNRPDMVPVRRGWTDEVPVRRGWTKNDLPKQEKQDRQDWKDFEKPRKAERNFEKQRPVKFEDRQKWDKPNKPARENRENNVFRQPKFERPNMKPPKQDNPARQNGGGGGWKQNGGGNPNAGGGNVNKGGGGGNPNKGGGGGGGKGGGKKN